MIILVLTIMAPIMIVLVFITASGSDLVIVDHSFLFSE